MRRLRQGMGFAWRLEVTAQSPPVPDLKSVSSAPLRLSANLLLPIAAAALVLEVVVRSDVATPILWSLLGVKVPDATARHAEVLACLLHGIRPGPAFTPMESNHLVEVAVLLATIRDVGVVAVVVLALIGVAGRLRRSTVFFAILRDGARLGGAVATAIAALCTQWAFAFRAVHPLLFPGASAAGGDDWDFPPDALLVRLYPDKYFAGVLGLVVVLWLAVLVGAWCFARRRLGPGARRPWAWSRWHAVAALLAVVLLPLCVVAGYHLWQWQGPAARFADGVLAVLLVGGLELWFARTRSTALVACAIGVGAWLALGLGVHLACTEANAIAARGDVIVRAIADYRDAHQGALPATLDDLVPSELPALPPVTIGSGHWYYQHNGTTYWFGFQGPLAWMYEYVSDRGTWNLQTPDTGGSGR
jgi:hypothetical protein